MTLHPSKASGKSSRSMPFINTFVPSLLCTPIIVISSLQGDSPVVSISRNMVFSLYARQCSFFGRLLAKYVWSRAFSFSFDVLIPSSICLSFDSGSLARWGSSLNSSQDLIPQSHIFLSVVAPIPGRWM